MGPTFLKSLINFQIFQLFKSMLGRQLWSEFWFLQKICTKSSRHSFNVNKNRKVMNIKVVQKDVSYIFYILGWVAYMSGERNTAQKVGQGPPQIKGPFDKIFSVKLTWKSACNVKTFQKAGVPAFQTLHQSLSAIWLDDSQKLEKLVLQCYQKNLQINPKSKSYCVHYLHLPMFSHN